MHGRGSANSERIVCHRGNVNKEFVSTKGKDKKTIKQQIDDVDSRPNLILQHHLLPMRYPGELPIKDRLHELGDLRRKENGRIMIETKLCVRSTLSQKENAFNHSSRSGAFSISPPSSLSSIQRVSVEQVTSHDLPFSSCCFCCCCSRSHLSQQSLSSRSKPNNSLSSSSDSKRRSSP